LSHELRTPLNGILGYTQILQRDARLMEKHHQAIEVIHHSAEHLLTMINDILDLSKIEAQRMELKPKDFHLPRFLNTLVDIVRIQADQKGLLFDYQFASDLPIAVYGDEKRLRQILLNLLSNAIKFTGKGGVNFSVTKRESHNSQLAARYPDQSRKMQPTVRLHFKVDDKGIGIPPEKLEEIFLPFHQVGDKRVQARGTGLGLPISRKLVRMMGAELYVSSIPGDGSTFWFELDLPETTEIPEAIKPAKRRNVIGFEGEKRKILIADDEEDNRSVIKDILLPLGFEVVETGNGQDTLNKAIEHQPALIFMDLLMPVMNGFETTTTIRQIPVLKNTKVIAVSASVFDQAKERSFEAGCDAYISKPFSIDHLLDTVQQHLKLEWIYEDVEEPYDTPKVDLEQATIIPPSQKALTVLLDLAMRGDVISLQEQAKALEAREPRLAPFSHKLYQLANNFLIEEIQEFLKDYMEETS
jgi:CheY-like chemotaxis protein